MPVILCNCPPPTLPDGTADGQVPVWDATAGAWIPGTAPSPDCCPPDGTADGDTLVWDGSEWVAQQPSGGIDSGTSFPASPSTGDIFYRTDLREIAYYDGARWAGDEMAIAFLPLDSFPYNITTSVIPFLAVITVDMVVTKATIGVFGEAGTWDASNYWTFDFVLRDSTGGSDILDTFNVQTRPLWDTFDFDIEGTVIDATDQMMFARPTPTGSPPKISAGFYFAARRIYT